MARALRLSLRLSGMFSRPVHGAAFHSRRPAEKRRQVAFLLRPSRVHRDGKPTTWAGPCKPPCNRHDQPRGREKGGGSSSNNNVGVEYLSGVPQQPLVTPFQRAATFAFCNKANELFGAKGALLFAKSGIGSGAGSSQYAQFDAGPGLRTTRFQ